ncbi:glycosyltransferase family A protein [Thermosediminibacter oceani]|uniref:Glycosyl transferase family 2 n=1 Tax=Thermosediminibacter oceani (strain ATCC BAA-1034 / DSM 16646 / JW/IW-1228P) TaxID=555079 RepID=D9S1J1_THEOJ|nr:glycosyltransferase family A protein [Thermosediminibacter oceani]ADL07268.1 glycosyl transferase family 2 [Thermosediminibacter oceani DSM 16646]
MPLKVAIVIPCYNYGEFVEEAVHSALSQDTKIELVIVDDGSTDPETLRVLDRLRARGIYVYRQSNRGLPGARNTGIRLTSAPYIVCLDADDIISPSYCSTCLEVLEKQPDVGFVYSTTRVFGNQNKQWSNLSYSALHLLVDNYIPYSAMFRRKIWEEVGGFDENMRLGYEDWDFWLSAVEKGWRGFHIPEGLFWYRKHGKSMLSSSNQHRKELKNYLRRKHHNLYSHKAILKLLKDEPFRIPRAFGALIKEEILRPLKNLYNSL